MIWQTIVHIIVYLETHDTKQTYRTWVLQKRVLSSWPTVKKLKPIWPKVQMRKKLIVAKFTMSSINNLRLFIVYKK